MHAIQDSIPFVRKARDTRTTYTFHEDAGHGWLEVGRDELNALHIADQITSYSYTRGDRVYLEEDCDLFTFAKAKRAAGCTSIEARHVLYQGDAPLRNFARFSA